ncbi:hypothetical protein NDU88_009409 [Pleurodeles waltl]|uniref:Uncharacterized protein n=1 Tax=Pleurodeles waltl TaxID=8319 RepID=A0AAV7PUM6_PLEWA|nr:hypothetical protein NDU88_009409 [Pleurodeles waltl]
MGTPPNVREAEFQSPALKGRTDSGSGGREILRTDAEDGGRERDAARRRRRPPSPRETRKKGNSSPLDVHWPPQPQRVVAF